MKRVVVLILLGALLWLPDVAAAHSNQELEEWLDRWQRRDSVALSVDLPEGPAAASMRRDIWVWLLLDMRQRHPCREVMGTWVEECERPTVPASTTAPEGSAPAPADSGSVAVDRGMGAGVEQWRGAVSAYDWNVEIALCLMAKESGGNPNAQNRSSGASGLMQVLPSWADNFGVTPADLFDPGVNLSISYALYVDGGWGHWSPWNRGECH